MSPPRASHASTPPRPRGATPAALIGGIAVILLLVAVGLTLASRRRPPPQTAADAWSVIPTPPAPRTAAARTGPRVAPDRRPSRPDPAAPPAIDPETVAPVDPAPFPTPPAAPDARPAPPDAPPPAPVLVVPPSSVRPWAPTSPLAPTPPDPAPAPEAPPTAPPPVLSPPPWLVLVAGPASSSLAVEAARRTKDAGLVTPLAEPFAFRASVDEVTPPDAEIRADAHTIVLVSGPEATVGPDPVADLVPPVRLLGTLLREVPLPVTPSAHAAAVVALAALLAGDGRSALAQLDGAPADVGVRVLRAAAALVARDYPAVHKATFGLAEDPGVGPVARVLTGAALRADRNAAEAVRDFEAALAARPDLWVARLLLAEACESDELQFADRAAAAYAEVVRVAPDEPAALLGHAYYLARSDRPAARALLERLVARAPGAAGAWRLLAWVRSDAGTSEDLQAAVAALERVVAILPDDASAWADLGGARWRWAGSGGGRAAMLGAAEAFARQTDLAPSDGTAWFRRGAAIHQAALDGPGDVPPGGPGDGGAMRTRLLEARTCYARALTLGLPKDQAARAHFNLGLVTEFLPSGAPPTPGVPASASAAYEAALAADPTYGPAAYALAAARVAERDGPGADAALARTPAAEGDEAKRERAVLEAAAAWARNDLARAKALLVGPAGVPAEGADPIPALGRALLVLGYRRATLTVLSGETRDVARLALRVRAYAGLNDADGVRAELARLRAIDPASADDLVKRDRDVARLDAQAAAAVR